MSVTSATHFENRSVPSHGSAATEEKQFNVVFTYNIATGSVRDAVELAISVISDQSGGYVEIFEGESDISVIEGELPSFPKTYVGEDAPSDVPDGSDITNWDQVDIRVTYNTLAESPEQALKAAVTVVGERSGGYVEVFCNGDRESVFESELATIAVAQPLRRPSP
jgi:hypothetical protein|nr:hypothetical protein [Neorhizobium tomejilense]